MKLTDIANHNPLYYLEPPRYQIVGCFANRSHRFIAPHSMCGYPCPRCRPGGGQWPYVPPDEYPCVHCGEFRRDHAFVVDDDYYGMRSVSRAYYACLFSPMKFKPMTQQELENAGVTL